MSPNRAASKPSTSRLLWLVAYMSLLSSACSLQLSPDVSNFIPGCAAQCLLSFISVNFGTSTCGTTPSLQCLCSHRGASGFTIGEGAVQCLTAELAIGFCTEGEANDEVISSAYEMCVGEPHAVEPTQSVLTATFLIPESGGIISFPSVTSTVTFPSSTEFPRSTAPTDPYPHSAPSSVRTAETSRRHTSITHTLSHHTQASSSPSPTSFLTTSPVSPAPTASSTNTTTSGAGQTAHHTNSSSDTLQKGQIAGISVGVAAVAGLALAAYFLLRYCRNRRGGGLKKGFLPLCDNGGASKFDKARGQSGHSWIVQQIRSPVDPAPIPVPKVYERSSWRSSRIGLALSPPFSPPYAREKPTPATPARRLSKLLPAKPDMPPAPPAKDTPRSSGQPNFQASAIPDAAAFGSRTAEASRYDDKFSPLELKIQRDQEAKEDELMTIPAAVHYGHDSGMTEFEEDGAMMDSEDKRQIWRPPSVLPAAAAPYYVKDKNGNWTLGEPRNKRASREVNRSVPPIAAMFTTPAANPSASQPQPTQRSVAPGASQPLRPSHLGVPTLTTQGARPSYSSSIYSPESVPQPLFSGVKYPSGNPQSAAPRFPPQPQAQPQTQPPQQQPVYKTRAASADSGITTFSTSSEDLADPSPPEEPAEQQPQKGSLSPVAESPASGGGRSPVTYPKIRDRVSRSSPAISTAAVAPQGPPSHIIPPPRRAYLYNQHGQPSPTLGNMQRPPPPGQRRVTPYAGPQQRPRPPFGHPAAARTGSPTMRIVEPSPEPDDRLRLPSARQDGPYPSFSQPRASGSFHPPQAPPYPSFDASSRHLSNRYPSFTSNSAQYPQPPREQHPALRPALRQGPPLGPMRDQSRKPPFTPQFTPQSHPSSQQQQQQQQQQPQQSQQQPPTQTAQDQEEDQQAQQTTLLQPPLIRDANNASPSPSSNRSTAGSTNSSLLAKRLGANRANGMVLPTEHRTSVQDKWQRRSRLNSMEPKTTPTKASGQPLTPTWMTPTRRGDDLFLNVQ